MVELTQEARQNVNNPGDWTKDNKMIEPFKVTMIFKKKIPY